MWHYFPLFDSVQTICILQPAAEGKTLERRTGRVEPNRVLLSFIDSGPDLRRVEVYVGGWGG